MTFAAVLARVRSAPWRLRFAFAGAFAVVLLVAVLAAFATRDTRVPLFATPLHSDQLAEVEQRLAAWNVPHATTSDNVRVERAKRSELLLRLALGGVPHTHLAGSGEALAHVGALTPQSVLEAQTREALAADLALGLRGIDAVADARVVIAPSSAGVYADEPRRDASASVRITLAPNAHLPARVVSGIKAFVAGGVPGLNAERVTVLDDRGLALEADGVDDGGDVQLALQSALDGAFGPGATIVRVHREPLGERRELHSVRRAASGGSIARTASDERYASNAKRYSRSSTSDDRGTETRDERRIAAPGATARLTVAVFVDAARALDLAKIRALAAAAAGLRADRGDAISVEAVAFSASTAVPRRTSAAPGWLLALAGVVPQLLSAIAIILIVAFTARPIAGVLVRTIESRSARTIAREVSGIPPDRVRAALEGEPPHVVAAIVSSLPSATAAAVLELYPPAERSGIVRRLTRANASLVPPAKELVRER